MTSHLYMGDRSIGLPDLHRRADRAAAGLRSLGVAAGDTVAVVLRNDLCMIEAALAAARIGACFVPVNWRFSPDEAGYVLEDCGAKAVVVHADLLAGIRDVIPPRAHVLVVEPSAELRAAYQLSEAGAKAPSGAVLWDKWLEGFAPDEQPPAPSPGSMIYTSGTTGRPKGVRRAARSAEEEAAAFEDVRGIFGLQDLQDRPDEVVLLLPGPLYHSAPNGWANTFVRFGANLVLEPRFDAEGLLKAIERRRVTHLLAVPTMFVRLLKLPEEVRRRYDVSSLRFVMHGAAPCPPHVKRAMMDWWGPVIWEHYGNTEVGGLTLCSPQEWLAHPGTVGRLLPNCQVMLLDEQGREVAPGQPGEIVGWRSTHSGFTYHGDPEKRAQAEKRPGLIALGDVGYFDGDGFLYLSGRSSDMVISGGVNIYPAEIEHELMKMLGVADCAVFGIPDEEFGERLCAHIQPEPGAALTADAVRAFVRSRMAGYKVPAVVEFSPELPREDSGKIFKRKLREPYWRDLGRQI